MDACNLKINMQLRGTLQNGLWSEKMRKRFNPYGDWLLQWGFLEGQEIDQKSDYLIPC